MIDKKKSLTPDDIIPIKKELFFLIKLIAVINICIIASISILYLLLNKNLGNSYREAFQLLAEAYHQLNVYIFTAILVQIIFSSLLVFYIALYYTHRIAGPMYRLKIVLRNYMNGIDINKVTFRKTDFIPGISTLFTDFFTRLNQRKKLLEESETIISQLPQKNDEEKKIHYHHLKRILSELEKLYE